MGIYVMLFRIIVKHMLRNDMRGLCARDTPILGDVMYFQAKSSFF